MTCPHARHTRARSILNDAHDSAKKPACGFLILKWSLEKPSLGSNFVSGVTCGLVHTVQATAFASFRYMTQRIRRERAQRAA